MANLAFGEAVRMLRKARKLSQAELAATAHLSRTHLSRIEGGQEPSRGTYQRLCGAFGFTIGAELLAAAGDDDAIASLAGYAAAEARRVEIEAKREREAARRPPATVVTRTAEPPTRRYADWLGEPRPKRPSAARRGYGKAHRQLRAFVLQRDPWCPGVPEGIHGNESVRTNVLDHIVSLRRGGSTTIENTRGLCRACNARKAISVEGAGYQGRAFAQRIERQRWGAS